jgi:hypothetical protein
MPKVITLVDHHMAAVKGTEVEESGTDAALVDVWELVFTDRSNRDQIRIRFRREARDEIVRQLTGGVVLAGGDLPRL